MTLYNEIMKQLIIKTTDAVLIPKGHMLAIYIYIYIANI